MKLLLAEDDAILADTLSASLSKAGFEVEVAPNGAVAEFLLLRSSARRSATATPTASSTACAPRPCCSATHANPAPSA